MSDISTTIDSLKAGADEIGLLCDQATPRRARKRARTLEIPPDSIKDTEESIGHEEFLGRVRTLLQSLLEQVDNTLVISPDEQIEVHLSADQPPNKRSHHRSTSVPTIRSKVQVFDLGMNERGKSARRPYEEEKRRETHKTRKRGACPACKKSRKRCREEHMPLLLPQKAGPLQLQPKPDARGLSGSAITISPNANRRSFSSITNSSAVIEHRLLSPNPVRISSFGGTLGSNLPTSQPISPRSMLPPRSMTPECPRAPGASPRQMIRRPSLPDVRTHIPYLFTDGNFFSGAHNTFDLVFDESNPSWSAYDSTLASITASPLSTPADSQYSFENLARPIQVASVPMGEFPFDVLHTQPMNQTENDTLQCYDLAVPPQSSTNARRSMFGFTSGQTRSLRPLLPPVDEHSCIDTPQPYNSHSFLCNSNVVTHNFAPHALDQSISSTLSDLTTTEPTDSNETFLTGDNNLIPTSSMQNPYQDLSPPVPDLFDEVIVDEFSTDMSSILAIPPVSSPLFRRHSIAEDPSTSHGSFS